MKAQVTIKANHLPMLRATKTGLLVQRGKHWDDCTYSQISAA